MWKGINGEIAWTLDGHYYLGCGNRGGREREVVYWDGTEITGTLTGRNAVGGEHSHESRDYKGVQCVSYQDKTGTLSPGAHPGSYNGQDAYNDMLVVDDESIGNHDQGEGRRMPDKDNFNAAMSDDTEGLTVRRLMPIEAERLQGFPDNWTLIGTRYDNGEYKYVDRNGDLKKCSDSARYKALGNSIAVGYANQQSGFWCWLARRIAAQYERQITLGSLFDGIGGFPLAFQAAGAKPVWASEIEDFCIEVTRRRFPEEPTIEEKERFAEAWDRSAEYTEEDK